MGGKAGQRRLVEGANGSAPTPGPGDTSTNRSQFLAACQRVTPSYVRQRATLDGVFLNGLNRMFAAWVSVGEQRGIHLRTEDPEAAPSYSFRGHHNWTYLGTPSWELVPAAIAESARIAAKRGGGITTNGRHPDIYKPLLKAIKQIQDPPTALHAGGPRAKVLSGEQELATELCLRCLERIRHTVREDETALLHRLVKMHNDRVGWDGRWQAANARAYGTDRQKDEAAAADSAAVQAARGLVGCYFGSQKCIPFVTRVLVRTIGDLEKLEGRKAAADFVVELDEVIMNAEFVAAFSKRVKKRAPAFERVLWRGADDKGFPATWLVRLAADRFGLLGKVARRWTWFEGDWDDSLAAIGDSDFESAIEIAFQRNA